MAVTDRAATVTRLLDKPRAGLPVPVTRARARRRARRLSVVMVTRTRRGLPRDSRGRLTVTRTRNKTRADFSDPRHSGWPGPARADMYRARLTRPAIRYKLESRTDSE